MFTGIVEEMGTVAGIRKGVRSSELAVSGKVIFGDLKVGDSVATNGVCLTVRAIRGQTFVADVMGETLSRSSLGRLKIGSPVNLERAMAADGRFGGHIVSGHIDGTGVIRKTREDANARWYEIEAPPSVMRYIVEKGSVTLDGISLTVARVAASSFSVSIIPHTLSQTVLGGKGPGDILNIENDMIGKYVEKLMGLGPAEPEKGSLTMDSLLKAGMI